VNGSTADSGGERLAKVSYFPGVTPPVAEPFASSAADSNEDSTQDAGTTADSNVQKTIARLSRAIEEIVSEPSPDELPETRGERSARAHNVSMHALTRRGMSSAEMTTLLRSRELDDDDVIDEVSRLERVGLLDDLELASNLVRTLQQRKGLGRSAINAELRRRKIDADAIEQALAELDGDDELSRAREVAMKRAPQLRSLDAETARRRLGAFLMRKGYSGSVVSSAVASALAPGQPTARGPRFE
jgi:regulatory protein